MKQIAIPYAHVEEMTLTAKRTIKRVAHELFPGQPLKLVSDPNSMLLSPGAIKGYPAAEPMLKAQLMRMFDMLPRIPDDVLFLDIETHNAEKRWDMPRGEFFRLGQYAWGEGPVQLTTSLAEVLNEMGKARRVIAHNGHNFDFGVLLGDNALHEAYNGKLFDTWVHAVVNFPMPVEYMHSNGRTYVDYGTKPLNARRWFGLDNMAYQFGVEGKAGDLKDLAVQYNPPKTKRKELDLGLIPVDDPQFLEYAVQDVVALREFTRSMLAVAPVDKYDNRSQFTAAIDAQMSRNGIRVDVPLAESRVAEAEKQKAALLKELQEKYNFPTGGKMPWRTTPGKEAIMRILADNGITPETVDWPQTATGNPSLGGEAIVALTEDTPVKALGQALAELQGQRPLAAQALTYLSSDGRVHPDIEALQRSGRRCIPLSHKILTRRGILSFDEVQIGDETLDVRNRWVKITDKHFYPNARVDRWETSRTFIECTPEHRWVQLTEGSGSRKIAPLDQKGSRRVLQLTPDTYPFVSHEPWDTKNMTEKERFAAVVGLLVTDGYCAVPPDRKAPKFRVYQTEGKFYDLFREMIPDDWVTNDTSRMLRAKTPLHEISLKREVLQPMMDAVGLDYSDGLRHSPSVMSWLLTLSIEETQAFLTAVFLADGSNICGTDTISTLNSNMVPVFQVAAYRYGRRSRYGLYQNERGDKSGNLRLTLDRVNTRNLFQGKHTTYETDVWCVSTESGTFTAWFPEGEWSGPYLTGNSVTSPGLTTWGSRTEAGVREKEYFVASPGHNLIEVDLSNADQRAVAFMSCDKEYAKRFLPGVDGHEVSGRLMFGDKQYDSDPKAHRDIAKALSHAYSYGAGPRKLSATSGQPLDMAEKFVHAMESAYPRMIRWQNRVRHDGENGWVTNLWGRTMPVQSGRSYTQAPALLGQSSTTELLYDTLINLYEADPGNLRYVLFPVHDALVCEVPTAQEKQFTEAILSCAHQTINDIEIFMEAGTPAPNWAEAMH